jgi:hypothetical protein
MRRGNVVTGPSGYVVAHEERALGDAVLLTATIDDSGRNALGRSTVYREMRRLGISRPA